jgi:hypothetical protein
MNIVHPPASCPSTIYNTLPKNLHSFTHCGSPRELFPMSITPIASLTDRTTWAKRNALQPEKIQCTREPARKLTDAEKTSCKLAAGLKKQKQTQLNNAVAVYILERTAKLQELTDNHNVKIAKIEDMVNAAMHYKKSHTPSLANAIVHYLSKTVNEGQSCTSSSIPMDSPCFVYQIYLRGRENPLPS